MRIVHLSHNGMPDPRVEKTALTLKKRGHTLVFVGGQSIRFQNLNAFDETHFMPVGDMLALATSRSLAKVWRTLLKELRPDLIHVHNIVAARYVLSFDGPVVYDDHELWSEQRWLHRPKGVLRKLARQPYVRLVPFWERLLVRKYPTLATNENAAAVLRRKGARWVGVTRNVPTREMVASLPIEQPRSGVVYVGGDFDLPAFNPHRDMTGLRNQVELDVVSGLPHREMLERICRYEVGLTPWHEHPILPFKDQNRNYEYLHAGLQVFVNRQIATNFRDDPYVHGFDDYRDLQERLERRTHVDPTEIAAHARERYLWEQQEHVILDAYAQALGRPLA